MSESYQVTYSPQALSDLKEIYSYIAFSLLAVTTAKNQINRIRKEIRSLAAMPERYAALDWEPWGSTGMRKMAVNHFVVFYRVEKENFTVTVFRILYGGMDIDAVLQETTE